MTAATSSLPKIIATNSLETATFDYQISYNAFSTRTNSQYDSNIFSPLSVNFKPRFAIQMEPNVGGYAQVNLLLLSSDKPVIVTSNTSILDKQENKQRTTTYTFDLNAAVDGKKKYKIFSILRTDLENTTNELLPENKLTIFCEFSLQMEHNKIENDEVSSEVQEAFDDKQKFVDDLDKMFQTQKFCDVTFVVGDAKFMAMKSILSAGSSEFKRLFIKSAESSRNEDRKGKGQEKNDTKKKHMKVEKKAKEIDSDEETAKMEKEDEEDEEDYEKDEEEVDKVENLEENVMTEYKITDIDANVFQQILRYIYTSKIPQLNENIEGFLYASDKYKLDSLKQICEVEMCNQLSIDKMYYTLMFADRTNSDMLKTKTLAFIKKHDSVDVFVKYLNQYPSDNERLLQLMRDMSPGLATSS